MKFYVTITETLKHTVEIMADTQQAAEQLVSDGWHNSDYILDSGDFVGVGFEVVSVDGASK